MVPNDAAARWSRTGAIIAPTGRLFLMFGREDVTTAATMAQGFFKSRRLIQHIATKQEPCYQHQLPGTVRGTTCRFGEGLSTYTHSNHNTGSIGVFSIVDLSLTITDRVGCLPFLLGNVLLS